MVGGQWAVVGGIAHARAIGIRAGCPVHGERRHPADWVRHPAEPSAKSMGQLCAVLRRFITETRTSNIQLRTSNFEPKIRVIIFMTRQLDGFSS